MHLTVALSLPVAICSWHNNLTSGVLSHAWTSVSLISPLTSLYGISHLVKDRVHHRVESNYRVGDGVIPGVFRGHPRPITGPLCVCLSAAAFFLTINRSQWLTGGQRPDEDESNSGEQADGDRKLFQVFKVPLSIEVREHYYFNTKYQCSHLCDTQRY